MRHVAERQTNHGRQGLPTQAGPGSRPPLCTPSLHPAVARLREGVELQAQILADRPALVATALLGGSTIDEIAAVLGWELSELRMAVGRWASQLRKAGQLTESQCIALQAVVAGPASQ